MKKYIVNTFAIATFAICGMSLTSCSDVEDIKDLHLARVLSPTGLEARVSNSLNIVMDWYPMEGASYYEIEAYADSPDYDQRNPDVKATTEWPFYTLENLVGETTYYIRVRAIDANDASRNSKWTLIDRTTGSEQNMNKVKNADITSTTVKFTWTPGIQVDKILVTPSAAGSSAASVEYKITDADMAAGSATVTGLTPETSYKAILKLGDKTRGTASFMTALDFSDAVLITPNDADWASKLQAGGKFRLAPGTYGSPAAKLSLDADVQIGADDPSNLPVINTYININNGASVLLYQVVLDGAGTEDAGNPQAIEFKTAGLNKSLIVRDCEIKNYIKGLMYINQATVIGTIQFDNCIIHDIVCDGGDMFDSRKGGWDEFKLTNSTIYKCAAKRSIIRCDDASAAVSAKAVTIIDHNTFYEVGSDAGTNQMFLYIRFAGNSTQFTNNMVQGFRLKRGFSNAAATTPAEFGNNWYYDTFNLVELADGNTETVRFFDKGGVQFIYTPFRDPAHYDFYIEDEALRDKQFGDPRWY